MASLLKSSVNVTAPRGAGVSRRASVRPVVLSRATTEQETTTSAPAYEIPDPNKADGFVAKDTAGQVNMFPTVMKPFEAGSSADTDKTGEDGTRVAALVGGGVAAALVAAGLLALTVGSGQPTETQAGEYLSLTSYQTKFASELGISTSPAVVSMSPGVVVLAPTPAPTVEAAEEVPAPTE